MNLFDFYLTQTDRWLLAAAGGCLAWLIPHRLALWRERRARRISAAFIFRSSVRAELKGLYPSPVQWPIDTIKIIDILEAKFPALESAVAEFRKYLTWLNKRRFDKAWVFYRLGEDGRTIDGQYYWQYVPSTGEGYENGVHYKHDTTLTYQTSFKKNVDHLLSFANET